MRLNGMFWVLTVLLLIILSVTVYNVFYFSSFGMFVVLEVLILITVVYLIVFYRLIIKPLQIIGDGMELLKEQDFSSRLREVGQPEADRIVNVFNKMMEQLKGERLHLREQNHFLDLLIEASPMGVIILNLDEQIQSMNPSACRIFEIKTPDTVEGKSLGEIHAPLAAELMRIEPSRSETIRLSNANIYKCTRSSFIDRGFHHPFYLVESLTEEVFKAEKKAYEKVIRMIAHEVNNTTAGITSILDTLTCTFRETAATEDVGEMLQIAIERCYKMSRFITDFADVVRIPEPQIRTHDLNSLVVNCKRFMENTCLSRHIRIRMDLATESPQVQVDNLLFEQVLVNILKNSAESIGSEGEIIITTSNDPVSLEIADTGKGIDPEAETKLFSPFFSTKPNGQGLGLIFIREVLQKHHASFSLRTHPDGLTRFNIKL